MKVAVVVTPQDAWTAAKNQLELQLDRGSYETWVKRTQLIEFIPEQNLFVVGAPNAYVCDMLQNRLFPKVRRVLCDVAGEQVNLRFELQREAVAAPAAPVAPDVPPLFRYHAPAPEGPQADEPSIAEIIRQPRQQDLPENELNARYTFDRFIVNKSNEMVYQAARAITEHPGTVYNPFLIYGGVGLGKTHILQAIGHACVAQGRRVLYVPSEVFTTELLMAIRSRTTAMFQQKYRTVDVLLIDDIQFIAGKETTQEEFFHTFNTLVQWNKQIVMVSDKHPRELALLDDRLRSRFQGGLVADIQAPEYETRRSILEMWAEEKRVTLEPAVLDMISQRAPGNVRELEGLFTQLLAKIKLGGGKAPLRTVEDTLTRFVQPRDRVTLERIIEVTAQKLGLPPADLVGKKRTESINDARQIAMYLARELTDYSLPQIGDAFGGRSHTTVLHGVNKIAQDIAHDITLKARIDKIKKAILS